jgi:hypothetical protein
LSNTLGKLLKKGFKMRDVDNYAILKHGPERNARMDADALRKWEEGGQKGKAPETRDWAGVVPVELEVGKSAAEFTEAFEEKAGEGLINELWKHTKAATDFKLDVLLESGLISRQTHAELKGRDRYYVPLMGHDEDTAGDVYRYPRESRRQPSHPLMRALGRKSRSESPFAYIDVNVHRAVRAAAVNTQNQSLLRLAALDRTGLLRASRTWYVDGVPREAAYSEDPVEYQENIEAFEREMEALQSDGRARLQAGSLDLGELFVTDAEKRYHGIRIWRGGKAYTLYVNGNPAVSMAVTGANSSYESDWVKSASAVRWMSANSTSRSPLFVLSNGVRDFSWAFQTLAIKEGDAYRKRFLEYYPAALDALGRYVRGKGDLSRQSDRWLSEFILNGGKTGFSQMVELDSARREMERDARTLNRRGPVKLAMLAVQAGNDYVENAVRLATYMTSRKLERSVQRSVSDAKEVTVNFNRRGTLNTPLARYMRGCYMFFNAGIQALSNFARLTSNNPGGVAEMLFMRTLSGSLLMPMLAAVMGGGEEYWLLSDWDRQNNLCIWTGGGFIKIPIAHEHRVFHALGDNAAQMILGYKSPWDAVMDSGISLFDLVPMNPVGVATKATRETVRSGASGGLGVALSLLSPDVLRPATQLGVNLDFKGAPIVNSWANPDLPGYRQVRTNAQGKPYAPQYLVDLLMSLDQVTGGDGVKKGQVSLNPDAVNHLARGYFGGLYTFASQVTDVSYKGLTGEEVRFRDAPLRQFFTTTSDLPAMNGGLLRQYRELARELEQTDRLVKGYRKELEAGRMSMQEFVSRVGAMRERIERYNRLHGYAKEIGRAEKEMKTVPPEQQQEKEKEVAAAKKTTLELLDRD